MLKDNVGNSALRRDNIIEFGVVWSVVATTLVLRSYDWAGRHLYNKINTFVIKKITSSSVLTKERIYDW